MTEPISADFDEFTSQANKVDDAVEQYQPFELNLAGTDAQSTGHVELSDNLPGFAAFVEEAVEALHANANFTANALREAGQDLCRLEDDTHDQIRSFEMPSFDGRGQAIR